MKRPAVFKERITRQESNFSFPMSFDMRNRFVLVATCFVVWSLLLYYHSPTLTTDRGNASSLKSLQVDTSALSRSGDVQNNLVDDRQDSPSKHEGSDAGSSETSREDAGRWDVDDKTKDPCEDRYVYIHSVPREFNEQLLEECHLLKDWSNMCVALSNAGLGPAMKDTQDCFTSTGWFETNQFTLEVIFHNRMKQYECLTSDATAATAVYVPFYAGLEASRTLWSGNVTFRDAVPLRFTEWVQRQPQWRARQGRDHFMVGGRITWDFRRKDKEWGNKLLKLPVMQNITSLVIEASPWDTNDVAIPYPTYFHPSSYAEIRAWQDKIRAVKRKVLFSFAGGTRQDRPKLIRGELMDQCRRSQHCKLLGCDNGACQSPQPVMKLFQESTYCLQPQGDSATRRSIFDSMLAGCIPVFFHRDSYSEYTWHLPSDQSEFSVYISEDHIRSGVLTVESVLLRISAAETQRMREKVIGLIPDLVYADPRVPASKNSRDAFSIALKGVLERFASQKQAELQ